jgi:hypothetical protein
MVGEAFSNINDKIQIANETTEAKRELITQRSEKVNRKNTINEFISNLKPSNVTDDMDLNSAISHMNELERELEELEILGFDLQKIKNDQEICKVLLKDDGIKSKIIKQYIPIINNLINKYLDKMNANYSFNLDEQFNEIIKSRYRDSFSYSSFSEGEKSRIDLALIFTWREIAKLKNSVNTNLLIMDEIGDSSMDGEGTDILWEILGELSDTNIFVISHRTSNVDKFSNHIEVVKNNNFSKLNFNK